MPDAIPTKRFEIGMAEPGDPGRRILCGGRRMALAPPPTLLHFRLSTGQEGQMPKSWSREHLIRRVDRYYLLAAAARLPDVRRRHVAFARRYRQLLSMALERESHHAPSEIRI